MANKEKTKKRPNGSQQLDTGQILRINAQMFDGAIRALSDQKSKIDPRKNLLAQMAGTIAAGIMSAPNEAPEKIEIIAAMSVEIAEEILTKIGVPAETSPAD